MTCTSTAPFTGTALTSYEAKIGSFGTVRGRVGLLVTDQLLIYGTGGLAYGDVKLSGITNSNAAIGFILGTTTLTPNTTAFSASKTKVGYSAGAGVEGSFWLPAKWTWKLEYLYLDLGSLDAATSFTLGSTFTLNSPATGQITAHARFTDRILRVGLNYKFGNYYVP